MSEITPFPKGISLSELPIDNKNNKDLGKEEIKQTEQEKIINFLQQ